MRSQRRLLCGGLGVTLLLAGAGSFLPAPAGADDGPPAEVRSLVAGASAQGMRMGYSVPDQFAVSQFIDGGGPVAQASVDSTGKAIGFGSLPYPGETAVAAPGALTLVTKVPVPPYPFYAEASYPVTPSAEVKDPGGTYLLAARAGLQTADGFAATEFGGAQKPVAQVTSTASGSITPSGAKVSATSIGEGFSFGDGLLKIASGTSRSVTTYAAGAAKPETKSELLIEGARVGDQAVTIGPDGVHPNGASFKYPGGADQLNGALGAAGISVRTLSLQNGDGGETTQALQVTVKHPIPGSTVSGTFVYEFGGSSSFIAFGTAGPGLPPLPDAGGSAPPADAASAASSAASSAPPALSTAADGSGAAPLVSAAPFASPAGRSSSDAGSSPLPAATDTNPAAPAELSASAIPAAPVAIASAPAALARPDLKKPGRVLMAVLAAAGAILLAASTLWRKAL
jgi:hypothetical protein